MNGTELKRFRLGLGYESAQQLAEDLFRCQT